MIARELFLKREFNIDIEHRLYMIVQKEYDPYCMDIFKKRKEEEEKRIQERERNGSIEERTRNLIQNQVSRLHK